MTIYKELFDTLRKLMKVPVNNIHTRNGIKRLLIAIAREVIWYSSLFKEEPGWSKEEKYGNLKKCYKKLLDPTSYEPLYESERAEICNDFARWVERELNYNCNTYSISDTEIVYLKNIMKMVMTKERV